MCPSPMCLSSSPGPARSVTTQRPARTCLLLQDAAQTSLYGSGSTEAQLRSLGFRHPFTSETPTESDQSHPRQDSARNGVTCLPAPPLLLLRLPGWFWELPLSKALAWESEPVVGERAQDRAPRLSSCRVLILHPPPQPPHPLLLNPVGTASP